MDYVTMQSRIANEYINESLATSDIKSAIQSAIKHYERRPWYFNQTTGSFPTVASQEYYTSTDLAAIPNIINIVSAKVTNSGFSYPLTEYSFQDLDEEQDGNIRGQPWCYAIWKQQIRLYPIPDTSYTITLSYIYRLSTLVNDVDTNSWMTDAEELIRQSAKRILALDILQADDLATRASVRERESFDELLAETRRRSEIYQLKVPSMLQVQSYNIETDRP